MEGGGTARSAVTVGAWVVVPTRIATYAGPRPCQNPLHSPHALPAQPARGDSAPDRRCPARRTAREAHPQGPCLLGLLPVPFGKEPELQGRERAAHLQMLRLRRRRRRL